MRVRFISILLVGLSMGGCSSDDDKPPPPDFNQVFGTLKPPTPDKLRGIWESQDNQGGGSKSTRLFFTDNYVVGAQRCIPSGASDSVIAGGAADLSTTALEIASGTFKMGSLNFQNAGCTLSLAGGTYNFNIQERSLTLATPNGTASVIFSKVGD